VRLGTVITPRVDTYVVYAAHSTIIACACTKDMHSSREQGQPKGHILNATMMADTFCFIILSPSGGGLRLLVWISVGVYRKGMLYFATAKLHCCRLLLLRIHSPAENVSGNVFSDP
jgi:hypothetical protein